VLFRILTRWLTVCSVLSGGENAVCSLAIVLHCIKGEQMSREQKSVRYDVALTKKYSGKQMHRIVERIAENLDLYISHIGGYSRVKYPNSIHWHFKEHPKEKGCLDATFWEEGNEFWIVARNYEPQWVKSKAKEMQLYMSSFA